MVRRNARPGERAAHDAEAAFRQVIGVVHPKFLVGDRLGPAADAEDHVTEDSTDAEPALEMDGTPSW